MGQPEVGLASPKNRRAQRSMGSEDALTPPRRRALTVNTKDNRSSDGGGGRGSGNGEATAAEKEIEAEPLSPTARLFHQPQFNCYIIVMMGIGRRIDVDVVKAGLETSLVRHPRFSSVQATSALSNRVLCHTTLSFSNIIGPVEEIGFYGHPMVYIAPSVYGHPHALTVHYQSYMGKMAMVLAVDELAVPDPHELLKDLAESLKLIKAAIPTGS